MKVTSRVAFYALSPLAVIVAANPIPVPECIDLLSDQVIESHTFEEGMW